MKKAPEATMQALLMHNNLIEKAKWTNFGYVIEQEGGKSSYEQIILWWLDRA